MGNEGFIVKTDADNQINWMLFSTTSNPFIELTTNNNIVYIKSTAGFFIALNVTTHEISILNNLNKRVTGNGKENYDKKLLFRIWQ